MTPQRNTGAGAEAERPEYAGHYRLESCLGSGGMGVVHLARSTSGLKLAVKVVHAEFAKDPEFRGRFRQEVAAARQVSGAFTASVVDADPEAGRPWMATLFIPGPTLAEQVKRNGPMAPAQVRRLMAGLAEALRDIHRVGVVHRDLKPSNVLLAEDGPKVIDFGISRPKDSELRTETGKLIGTPPFMAPEQFRRPREVGPAADVFALGSVLVHAATGRGPFDSDSPYIVAYQVVHDEPDLTGVPEDLAPLVLRCLAKEPEDRPTPDELMRELRSTSAAYDTQAFVPGQWDQGAGDGLRAGEDLRPGDDLRPGSGPRSGAEGRAASEGQPGGEGRSGSGAGRASRVFAAGPVRRRTAVVAGALGLVVAGTFGALQWFGDDGPAPVNASARATAATAAAFDGWAVRPVAGRAAVPQCAYGAGTLFCAQSGEVVALAPADGAVRWRRPVGQAGAAAPVLSGGLVHVTTADGRQLAALDPASGRTRWSRAVPAGSGWVSAGGTLLLTGGGAAVTGVDGASGRTRWSHSVPGDGAPLLAAFPGDPLAYATSTSGDGAWTRIAALDPGTGAVRWEARLKGSLRPVGAEGGSVYFLGLDPVYGDARSVVRYTAATKAVRRVALPVPRQGPQADVRDGVVHVLASGGALEAVDAGTGRRLWELETAVSRGSAPVSDAGHVYVTAADGRLLAVDARTGRLLGQTRPRLGDLAGTLAAPVVADGRAYAGAPDGALFAVDAERPAAW
ncbi:PQQ-binding-like beta-propeller repeat protein [Streptomyces sp. NPDC047017]|uniref:protein kinase domain-containing protein n=1 Tax=Streptomyces sp. NPDC047017 TaxID=3155024 RepID=UPI0033EBE69C